ncbi:MAG: hypothetical protein WAR57_11140 [Candidatus Phosphoribacter sp.]
MDIYERFTSAVTSELVDRPGAVADRLVGRFVRDIGVESWKEVLGALD